MAKLNNLKNLTPSVQFAAYVEQGKRLASTVGLAWKMELDSNGYATADTEWNLRTLIKDGNPLPAKLRNFSIVSKAKQYDDDAKSDHNMLILSESWQDLIKAYTLNHIVVLGLSHSYLSSVCNALRIIATLTNQKPLWLLTDVDLRHCIQIARKIQPSGQTAIIIGAFVKTTIDAYHLALACPLFDMIDACRPASPGNVRAAKFNSAEAAIRSNLASRKSSEKLPEQRAFWELIRIIFTEQPKTYLDSIRFAQCKLLVLTGLRIGEISMIPHDWKRVIEYRDRNGDSASLHGGFASSTLLRHFAEKQGSKRREIGSLWENTQYIPSIFEELITTILEDIKKISSPLRKTLINQHNAGRILPNYHPDTIVPISELYSYLTGNVLYKNMPNEVAEKFFTRYRADFDVTALEELSILQSQGNYKINSAFYTFANRLRDDGVHFRNADGSLWAGRGVTNQFVKVEEIENYVRARSPTKLSDLASFKLDGGAVLKSSELMFLIPKRAVSEGRGNNPCHVGKTVGVGIATPEILGNSLTSNGPNGPSLFQTYAQTTEEKKLLLLPHSLRHLQNTELFRLGVADTIITKRFNRRSTVQSYEYDHRSLQEELEQISLPDEWEEFLGERAGTVAKLIKTGRANGPIVAEFRRLEIESGAEMAYSYLKGEADGFHATPYGHCLNSFSVAPCPTHLECFNGCVHLSATDLPENRRHLVSLQGKLKSAVELARSKPTNAVGRKNQIQHAQVRIENIEKLLATKPGQKVFPNGRDLSIEISRKDVFNGT